MIKRFRTYLLVVFGLLAFGVLSGSALAATPAPPQCIMNVNVLGGTPVYTKMACTTGGADASTFANNKCYNIDNGAVEVDCTKPPINNIWQFKCQGSDTVFQSYIVPDPNNPSTTNPDNDPVKQCAAAGATYVADTPASTPPTAPTGHGNPTIAPTAQPAPSGSGNPTTNNPGATCDNTPGLCDSLKLPSDTNPNPPTSCGKTNPVTLSIDLGCKGQDPAILDLIFAIIRLLSVGVGIIVVASIVFAGIQYTASRGDPQAVAQAQERVRSSVIALVLFIFSFAILNWLIPAGLLH